MAERLSWKEIEERYHGEWVEMIDYDWPEGKGLPVSGVVRVHSPLREQFDRLALVDPSKDAAVIFVGAGEKPRPGVVPCPNLHRVVVKNAGF